LWPIVAEDLDFVENLLYSRMTCTGTLLTSFSRELKTKKNIFGTTWPAGSLDLNVTENVCLAVKLKLHIETDVIKM